MNHRVRLIGTAAAAVLTLTACGSNSSSDDAAPKASDAAHEHTPGMDMSGMDMSSDGSGPSPAAAMICSEEIRDSVAKILDLDSTPSPTDDWSKPTYTCTYELPDGTLEMTVEDSPDEASGQKYFDQLKSEAATPVAYQGMASFTLPSFHTDGVAVFLKDGKTLRVDATGLSPDAPREHQDLDDVAYAVAAGVIACWSE